jgi:hypothetical protein
MADPIRQPAPIVGPSEVDAIAKLALLASGPMENSQPHGRPFVVIPPGHEVEVVPEPPLYPDRAVCTVELRDAPSFIDYITSIPVHPILSRRIYAQLTPAAFECVMDDHAAVAYMSGHDPDVDVKASPAFREFRVKFLVPPSREWELWTKGNKTQMTQVQFAALLEDNLPDIAEPSGADLLEAALDFEASKAGSFRSVQRLADGSTSFEWIDETNAKGGAGRITMPAQMTLSMPVFERGDFYSVTARIRYKLNDGKLALWYELVRPHKVLEEAFMAVWGAIERNAGCGKILLGKP